VKPTNAKFHFLRAATFVREATIGVFEMPVELACSTGKGGFDVGGLIRDDEGLMTFWAGFKKTSFVSGAGVFVGFAGQVYLDSCEVGFESTKDIGDIGSDGIGELVMH
jgi:hypothetical protein